MEKKQEKEMFRNPRYSTADGSFVDVDLNHPVLGWIPHTVDLNKGGIVKELDLFIITSKEKGEIAPYQEPES